MEMSREFYNLRAVWDGTHEGERRAGALYWFRLYGGMVDRIGTGMGTGTGTGMSLRLHNVAGAFAALSPNNTYAANVVGLDRLLGYWRQGWTTERLEGVRVPAYGANKRKAVGCLRAATVEDVERVLRGRKMVSFFRNIMDPENRDGVVTIDGHMVNLMRGTQARLNHKGADVTGKQYGELEQIVAYLAQRVGVQPSWLQASVWLAYKRIRNIAHDPQERLWV